MLKRIQSLFVAKSRRHSRQVSVDAASERLEPRALLTGVIAVKIQGNNLTFIGDGGSNELEIRKNDGNVWLIAANGTTFSGDAAGSNFVTNVPINQVGNIKANLKGGDDEFQVTRELSVRGKTAVNMGDGDDLVEFDSSAGGAMGFSHGNTTIKTGRGNDEVKLEEWTFNGNIKIATGSGDDDLLVGRFEVNFNGKIADNLGSGNDFVSIAIGNVGGNFDSLFINGGSGFDEINANLTEAEWAQVGRVKGFERFT